MIALECLAVVRCGFIMQATMRAIRLASREKSKLLKFRYKVPHQMRPVVCEAYNEILQGYQATTLGYGDRLRGKIYNESLFNSIVVF